MSKSNAAVSDETHTHNNVRSRLVLLTSNVCISKIDVLDIGIIETGSCQDSIREYGATK